MTPASRPHPRVVPAIDAPPLLTIEVHDGDRGHLGYVVIDRPVHGAAWGGVRFSVEDDVPDLARIARAMTLKWGFLNVPMGGAKALIDVTPDALGLPRPALMAAFGRAIAPLVRAGLYIPGVDLGTTLDDLLAIMAGLGRPLVADRQIDASYATALTAFEAIRCTLEHRSERLADCRVALEGLGKVGGSLAELLDRAGARLVALSTADGAIAAPGGLEVARLLALRAEHGSALVRHYPAVRTLTHEELFVQDVDVLVPGSRPRVIHAGNADHVRARYVLPFSNVPMTPDAERRLHERGILTLPDFVVNCGGIFAAHAGGHGFDIDAVEWMVQTTFAALITALLRRAARDGRAPADLARELAWLNHLAFERGAAESGRLARARDMLQREGWPGVRKRAAWRAHARGVPLSGPLAKAARARFADMTLARTLERLERDPPR